MYLVEYGLGFWYVSVELEKELSTAIANSSDARAAFISGKDLPPDLVVKR